MTPLKETLVSPIAERLRLAGMLSELERALLDLVAQDAVWIEQQWPWGTIIPAVCSALGGDAAAIAPFERAWALMYAAIVHLDHFQDGDADAVLGQMPPMATANLLLSYYVLATSLLDDFSVAVPVHRERRLRRLWSKMLRTASGQQRDLAPSEETPSGEVLEVYQKIAQAKTGSTFALAFGGTAALITDEPALLRAALVIGDIFGTLVQIQDDVLDAENQPNQTTTFPLAFDQLVASRGRVSEAHTPAAFRHYLYQAYRDRAAQALAGCDSTIASRLLAIFDDTFAPPPQEPGSTR
jgi:hypothetical protein